MRLDRFILGANYVRLDVNYTQHAWRKDFEGIIDICFDSKRRTLPFVKPINNLTRQNQCQLHPLHFIRLTLQKQQIL